MPPLPPGSNSLALQFSVTFFFLISSKLVTDIVIIVATKVSLIFFSHFCFCVFSSSTSCACLQLCPCQHRAPFFTLTKKQNKKITSNHIHNKCKQKLTNQNSYKDRIRAELDRQLRAEFDKRTSAELNQAVPPTETLNVEAAKDKAGLARQGSLAERQPPASLVQKRQLLMNNETNQGSSDIPMMEDEVSTYT